MADDKSILKKARAKFVELYSRVTPVNKDKDEAIYYNGENNLYPNEMERVILNSPTAKQASKMLSNYISGKGIEGLDPIVNEEKNYKLSNIVKIAAVDLARQNGVFFHIGYKLNANLNLEPVIDVLEYVKTRIGKEDDDDNITKFYFKDFSKTKCFINKKENDTMFFYPFSPLTNVIEAQIKTDYLAAGGKDSEAGLAEMLPYFRGQVYYLNMTPEFKYALSPFDTVYNDMDSEFRISMYINRQVRMGFLGKTCIVTAGLDEEQIAEQEENIKKWLGSENTGGAYTMHLSATDDIDKVFKIIQVPAEIDDKLFADTKLTIRSNIYGAANNIPEQLVKSDDTLFGTNSGTYVEMKKFYTEQTENERKAIEDTLAYLGFPCKIIPIINIENESTTISI